MSITDNIGSQLDKQFENSNYLPQRLEILDFDKALFDYFVGLNFSLVDSNDNMRTVPVIKVTQELWAERKQYWQNMTNEQGEEISRPLIAFYRKGVKQGTSPLKRTIPVRRKFTYVKVPKFNGTTKGYDIYKIPQPAYVDIEYEIRFVSSYMMHVNKFYEKMMLTYSDRQAYMTVNGHQIRSIMNDPSEDNQVDLDDERIYQVSFPITVFGKLVDPTEFEKHNAVTRVSVKITESRD
jgi:hypothetical protein